MIVIRTYVTMRVKREICVCRLAEIVRTRREALDVVARSSPHKFRRTRHEECTKVFGGSRKMKNICRLQVGHCLEEIMMWNVEYMQCL